MLFDDGQVGWVDRSSGALGPVVGCGFENKLNIEKNMECIYVLSGFRDGLLRAPASGRGSSQMTGGSSL